MVGWLDETDLLKRAVGNLLKMLVENLLKMSGENPHSGRMLVENHRHHHDEPVRYGRGGMVDDQVLEMVAGLMWESILMMDGKRDFDDMIAFLLVVIDSFDSELDDVLVVVPTYCPTFCCYSLDRCWMSQSQQQ
jgi:hypothetical protein